MIEKPLSEEEEHKYWIDRHRQYGLGWQSVGFSGDERISNAFYECRRQAWRGVLQRYGINLKGMRVLDVGCGVGTLSKLYHEAGAEVYGIDISPQAVAHCNSLNIGTFVEGSIADLTTKLTGSFDLIHCFDVLYHLTDATEWEKAIEGFSTLSNAKTLWLITEIHTSRTYASSSHVVKRSVKHYQAELGKHKRSLDAEVPLYWFYSAFPGIAGRFPWLITASNGLGTYFKRLVREYAALWVIRNTGS